MDKRASRNTTAGSATNPGSRWSRSSRSSFNTGLVGRRRALDGHGNDLFSPEEDEAESAAVLAFLLGLGALGWGQLAELFAVAEDEIHVTVESHEFADQLAAVLDVDPHPVVDVLEHLGALGHRHCGGSISGNSGLRALGERKGGREDD